MIDAIAVPRGAEERAVRRALARAEAAPRVLVTGIGPHAAARAAEAGRDAGIGSRVLVTGLCGLLSPAFTVGDVLVYRDIRRDAEPPIRLDETLSDEFAGRLPGSQSGIRALASDRVIDSAAAKAALARRYGVDAVDMESFAFAEILGRAGVRVAVVRIGSDAASEDLPDLNRALDGAGGLDGPALALAMLVRPVAGIRLARNGARALAALERAVYSLVARAV